jgi:hypothetical protein
VTAFGMISFLSMDERVEGRAGRPMPAPRSGLALRRPVNPVREGIAPRPKPGGEAIQKRWNWAPKGPLVIQKGTTPVPFVNRPAPVVDTPTLVQLPASVPLATSFQPISPVPAINSATDLPPILPAEVVPPPKAAGLPGFFDQELIPGEKNLYLAGGAVGVMLLLVVLTRKK